MKSIWLFVILIIFSGCAELSLAPEKVDCHGVRPRRSGTGSYPCVCCPDGWRGR